MATRPENPPALAEAAAGLAAFVARNALSSFTLPAITATSSAAQPQSEPSISSSWRHLTSRSRNPPKKKSDKPSRTRSVCAQSTVPSWLMVNYPNRSWPSSSRKWMAYQPRSSGVSLVRTVAITFTWSGVLINRLRLSSRLPAFRRAHLTGQTADHPGQHHKAGQEHGPQDERPPRERGSRRLQFTLAAERDHR